ARAHDPAAQPWRAWAREHRARARAVRPERRRARRCARAVRGQRLGRGARQRAPAPTPHPRRRLRLLLTRAMSGLRIGTRASALALAQTRSIADMLAGGEVVTVTTSGDLDSSGSHSPGSHLAENPAAGSHLAGSHLAGSHPPSGDKSRWVDAIEDALLAGEIDLAVHSAKDLPGELPDGLE